MFELKNWKLDWREEQIVGRGRCYGNPRFPEGSYIHTSHIVKAEVLPERERILLITHSGSHYALDFGGFDEESWETTAELFKVLGLDFNRNRCEELKEEAEKRKKKGLEDVLRPRELYVRVRDSLMAEEAYYRTEQGEIVKMTVGCHVGMFTNSVIIGGCSDFLRGYPCGWRYLIDGGRRITCYFWDGPLDAVQVFNEGGDFVAENGGTELLCKEDEMTEIKRPEMV